LLKRPPTGSPLECKMMLVRCDICVCFKYRDQGLLGAET